MSEHPTPPPSYSHLDPLVRAEMLVGHLSDLLGPARELQACGSKPTPL